MKAAACGRRARPGRALAGVAGALGLALLVGSCHAQETSRLALERRIPLAGVRGRIDHLAVDPRGGRLFVAELGNGSVEALDLASGRSLGRIGGLREPQGVAWLAERDELVVATGGDGLVRFYRAADLSLAGSLRLGGDADNLRLDGPGRVVVGYGKALALVDATTRSVVRTIPLPAHPEGFQVSGGRAIVNLPGAGALAVVDLQGGRELARWGNPGPSFNFPLALDEDAGLGASVYRLPARLVLFAAGSGKVLQQLATCGDADDAFFDKGRHRLYVVCGGGAVEVFQRGPAGYVSAGRVRTRSGARTGVFAPALDRLFVAARAAGGREAAILVFRPVP